MLSKANVTEFCCIVLKDEKGRKVEGGRDPQRKLMKQNQRKPLSNKSGLFIMQPSEKENKRGLGQEIELEVREEGIEISQCSLTKLLCPSKKNVHPQEPACGMGRLILAWIEKAVGPTIADWFPVLTCRIKPCRAYCTHNVTYCIHTTKTVHQQHTIEAR